MTNQVNIAEKLMVVRLNCSFSFGRITDRPLTAEVNHANKTHALQVKKELFPQDAGQTLRALQAVLSSFYAYHKQVTLSSINEGERLMPVPFYLDYMKQFGDYQQKAEEAYAAFVSSYSASKARAAVLLGPAYCATDYPPSSELRGYLKFKVLTLPLPQAGVLLDALGDGIQSDVDTFISESVSAAFTDINERMKVALQRMVDSLANYEVDPVTGKVKKGRLYDTLVNNLKELVSFIPEFNVTEDDSLKLLCDEVKQSLLVHSVDTLRVSPDARAATAAAAASILKRMQ